MFRILGDLVVANDGGKAYGNLIEIPTARGVLELDDEVRGSHFRAGIELSMFDPFHQQLHVRAADIDDQGFVHAVAPCCPRDSYSPMPIALPSFLNRPLLFCELVAVVGQHSTTSSARNRKSVTLANFK